ncbi:MAG: hypothetical protein ACO3I1_06760 [Burkholderiales bacterium]
MDVPEYYMSDFESYSELFKAHTEKLAKLMKIMDESIIHADLPPVGRPKDLFRMVLDMSYQVDRAYKKANGIKDPEYIVALSTSRDQMKEDMKTIFVEEFNRFLSTQNDNQ